MSKTLLNQFKGVLTKTEKVLVTKYLLRTDLVSLIGHGYDVNQLADLIDSPVYLNQEITKFEDQIRAAVSTKYAKYFLNQAENLGFTMAKGFSPDPHTIPNAYGISRMWGVKLHERVDEATSQSLEPVIDALASLRAVQRMEVMQGNVHSIVGLLRREATTPHNGVTFLLGHHQLLKQKALADNFNNNPALMRKGYMPDISNPYLNVQVAAEDDAKDLELRGYKLMYVLEKDATDPNTIPMAMYLAEGAGLAEYVRTALSNTSMKTKGMPISNYSTVAVMEAMKLSRETDLFNTRKSPNFGRNPVHMQAVFNEDGEVSGYRYIMAEATKDDLLERNDDFSEVLGKLAGNIYDKSVTTPHNHMVIEALKQQHEADTKAGNLDNYLRVEPGSTDPELREMWAMMPRETRQFVKDTFGTESVPIRAEFLRVIYGYRKVTVASLWEEGAVKNNYLQDMVKNMIEVLGGPRSLYYATKTERIWQETVRTAKQNVVVRMGTVTMTNLLSNTYQLMINGLGLTAALTDQYTGYKKAVEYVKQGSRINEIKLILEAGHTPTQHTKLISELNQLKHLQSINPAGKLIEAGLLQTIVMDVNQDVDPFSYGSKLASSFDEKLNALPGGMKDAVNFTLMTRGSDSYEFMNRIVQFSDFAGRYAMFKHLTTRAVEPMSENDAINEVINEFINYDLPTHRNIQYGNDMGYIWFSRYWIRSQKIILKNFAEHPGRVLTGLALQGMLGEVPNSGDSSILNTGLIHPIGGVDRVMSGLMANPILPNW
jgi:hypothetical protein